MAIYRFVRTTTRVLHMMDRHEAGRESSDRSMGARVCVLSLVATWICQVDGQNCAGDDDASSSGLWSLPVVDIKL